MSGFNQVVRTWALPAYLILITCLSLLPGNDLPRVKLFPHFDKLIHACMYAGLTFLAIARWTGLSRSPGMWILFLSITLYGSGIEGLQAVLSIQRSFDFFDILSNALGFFPGWAGWRLLDSFR